VTVSTVPQEQGQWAAQQAINIIEGVLPAEIPIVQNIKAKRFLNMKIARRLGIKFPISLLQSSNLVSAKKQKILYVNSYHRGYKWSDDIEKGLLKSLGIKRRDDDSIDTAKSFIDLKIFRMNTKLRSKERQIKLAALKAKQLIETWQPDVIVTSDDNAAKFLIQPYYLDASIPFIFCGINYDASVYNLPAENITGMIEVEHLIETIALLKKFAGGERIGYIGSDDISNRKSLSFHKHQLGIHYSDGSLVSTIDSWKNEYKRLQTSVDMLIIINPVGIRGWDPEKVDTFLLENTEIPSGAVSDSEIRYSLLGNTKIAEEQGWWAGTTALKILNGVPPAGIKVTKNQKTRLYINMPIANRLGIKFPVHLLNRATMLNPFGSRN
jgi:ABC-type uncharacterized transport system substrate-binding protein